MSLNCGDNMQIKTNIHRFLDVRITCDSDVPNDELWFIADNGKKTIVKIPSRPVSDVEYQSIAERLTR